MIRLSASTASCILLVSTTARADVLRVGPGQTYQRPCAAFAAAQDGDTVEIDGRGSYVGDVCVIAKDRLHIRGVMGRPHIQAGGKNAGGKAIWVVQGDDTVVEDIEFSGCTVPDKNGAGIRQEGTNLTVRRCSFHDNENGILGGADAASTYVIEDSEFANNGAGDGQSHNMYIGEIASFTLRGSYSHDAKVGHLVKSRALVNHILYNRLTDDDGNASYQLDLPQGGRSYVIGNAFQKSASASNGTFISFAREAKRNPDSALWAVNNTFVNARSAGVFVGVAQDVTSVVLRNNIFSGAGTPCDLSSATLEANLVGEGGFVMPASYDYHLRSTSPAIDSAVAPGAGAGVSLAPVCEYAHPAHAIVREQVGLLDRGAFELGSASNVPCGSSVDTDAGAEPARDAGIADAGVAVRDASVWPDASAVSHSSDGGAAEDARARSDAEPTPGARAETGCALRAHGGLRDGSIPLSLGLLLLARRRKRQG